MGGLLEAEPPEAGLHLLARIAGGYDFREDPQGEYSPDDVRASKAPLRAGVEALPLSAFYAGTPLRPGGLVLGHAGYGEDEIAGAVEKLRGVFVAQGV